MQDPNAPLERPSVEQGLGPGQNYDPWGQAIPAPPADVIGGSQPQVIVRPAGWFEEYQDLGHINIIDKDLLRIKYFKGLLKFDNPESSRRNRKEEKYIK